jgi:hypothetical protein
MNLRFKSQVQVSRMMPLLSVCPMDDRENAVASVPDDGAHGSLLLTRNSKHRRFYAHFAASGVDSPLLTPRQRCYALLSLTLSRLVLESRRNSYQARQDGLW